MRTLWYRRKFLQFGFQDECLPKDLDAFITFCKGFNPGVEIELLRSVRRVNQRKSKQIDGNIPLGWQSKLPAWESVRYLSLNPCQNPAMMVMGESFATDS